MTTTTPTSTNGTARQEGARMCDQAERSSRATDRILVHLDGETAVQVRVIKVRACTQADETCWRFLAHLQRAWRDAEPELRRAVADREVARFLREQAATLEALSFAYQEWTATEGMRATVDRGGLWTAELVPVPKGGARRRLAGLARDGIAVLDGTARDGAR